MLLGRNVKDVESDNSMFVDAIAVAPLSKPTLGMLAYT